MADSNQVIAASLQFNTDEAVKNALRLKGEVENLRKEFNKAEAGSDAQLAALKKLNAAEADLTKTTQALTGANEKSSGNFGKLKEGIGSLPGPLAGAGEGVGKLSTAFKALLANPVVLIIAAIVAALALLYKAFTNSFEGGEKMEQVFAAIKAAGQALIDNITKIAGAIVKLFKFDFSGAINDIKEVGKAIGEAAGKMFELTKQAQELKREQLANDLDQAKRAKELAILREEATDESIPIAKRKAALLDLKKEAEQNSKDDIDLARRTTANKIAQLTLQKDGAKKNLEEITKLKIEQIQVETDNANELRRIGKQITAADKQEKAEQKETATKAKEAAKKIREELVEFTNKLQKIQQENELAGITDAYEKEKKQIENRIADERRANDVSLQEKKLTRSQFDQLNAALEKQSQIQLDAARDKHNKEVAQKEADFQKELATITGKTQLDALADARKIERAQLDISYAEKLADAIKRYKDDAVKLQAIRNALEIQQRADQAKLDAKFAAEDRKKQFELKEQKIKAIVEDKKKDYADKVKALDDEQILIQQAFDNKTLTELEYNAKVADLAAKRMQIADLETAHKKKQVEEITGALGALGELVGKQTIAGKALGIATALINTYQGASEAIKQKSTLPSPFDVIAKIANVAAIIATGLATVRSITRVEVPGGGGGGSVPAAPSITAPAPVAPTQSSTALDQNSLSTLTNQPNRTFVLDADVQNSADRNARLNRQARLGGS